MTDTVKVAVRLRPFVHAYEKGSRNIVKMDAATQQTVITHPETGRSKTFRYDYSYDSFVPEGDPNHASQDKVWEDLGILAMENAWKGYNVSLFAYGQTGSGKSHSMVGFPGAEGIVPRACREIFTRIAAIEDGAGGEDTTCRVEVSMIEIYNEKVRDLFNPNSHSSKVGLKIRDHPKTGPYVQDLTHNAVDSYARIRKLMDAGTAQRTVAATAMNETSSRAHTIFQIRLTQTTIDRDAGKATDRVSLMSLIDLAGSERTDKTMATGDRLKEGCAINQSLSALGNVISVLCENAGPGRAKVVPYRDSKLTHLLKNSLGGNAKTIMIAAIAPTHSNYEETLSTLRYADRAKRIKNKAIVNDDPNMRLIKGLRQEIEELKRQLKAKPGDGAASSSSSSSSSPSQLQQNGALVDGMLAEERKKMEAQFETERQRMKEQMAENERLLQESEKSWEERLKDADRLESELAKRKDGAANSNSVQVAEKAKKLPHLVNLNADPFMSECLMYFLEQGDTNIGRKDADVDQDIALDGLNILKHHCVITNRGGELKLHNTPGAKTYVNGEQVPSGGEAVPLHHGNRLILGQNQVFRIAHPDELRKMGGGGGGGGALAVGADGLPEVIDWEYAIKEANATAMSAFTDGDRKAREEAESEAREMEAKVQALERRMAEERQAALHATGKQQEEMLRRQKELEEALRQQIEETERLRLKKERERQERSLLDEQLLRTIPLVNEANAISDEIERGMTFSIKLMANRAKAKLAAIVDGGGGDTGSNGIGGGSGGSTNASPTGAGGADGDNFVSYLETEIWIKVENRLEPELPDMMWSHEKFMNRLYLMREMYQTFVEGGRELLALAQAYTAETDPFYDPPGSQLIGRALIYLDSLSYFLEVRRWWCGTGGGGAGFEPGLLQRPRLATSDRFVIDGCWTDL